jgi:hypothetical protein
MPLPLKWLTLASMAARPQWALLVIGALHTAFGCGSTAQTASPGGANGGGGNNTTGGGGASTAAGTTATTASGAQTAGSLGSAGSTTSGGQAALAGATSGGATELGGAAGALPSTMGDASSCSARGSAVEPWPGQDQVKTLDPEALATSDLSGLTYEPSGGAGVLWAVNNGTSKLFRLLPTPSGFAPDAESGWASGKTLHYPDGAGQPDAEGVTFGKDVADGVYVCAEHDGANAAVSRPSVLRYTVSDSATSLTATHEWNLTLVLPKLSANTGIEGITWVPDTYLTGHGFWDEGQAHLYAPAEHANHGTGLFFVGVEESGKIYAVALDHDSNAATLVATIATPNAGVMGLEFDRDDGSLWFNCDDGCGNKSGMLGIDTGVGSPTQGRFIVLRQFQRPASLPNTNNEGIALAPKSQCSGGFRPFYWTDDADDGGHSIRGDSIPCAACF